MCKLKTHSPIYCIKLIELMDIHSNHLKYSMLSDNDYVHNDDYMMFNMVTNEHELQLIKYRFLFAHTIYCSVVMETKAQLNSDLYEENDRI